MAIEWHQEAPRVKEIDYTILEPPANVEAAIGMPSEEHIDSAVVFDKPTDAEKKIASDLASLIKSGNNPNRAAQMMGSSLKELMSLEAVRYKVKQVIESYTLHADVRKLLVRAVANKVLLDTMNVDGKEKLALEAAKLIQGDPEVGMQQNTVIGVLADKETMEKLFSKPVDFTFADEEKETE